MINKQDFEQLEDRLDNLAKEKKLTSKEGKTQLDHYFSLIESYFCQINQIDKIDFNQLENYHIVPINFNERFQYITQRKHHFMGYRQMKTLKTELVKMNAAYQARQSHQKNNK